MQTSWIDEVRDFQDGIAVWVLRALGEREASVVMSQPLAAAVRAALLCDLILARVLDVQVESRNAARVHQTDREVGTDFAPAVSALSNACDKLPTHGLWWWLQRGRPYGRSVARELVTRGEWRAKSPVLVGHYDVLVPAVSPPDVVDGLSAYFDGKQQCPTANVAVLTTICAAVGILGLPRRVAEAPEPVIKRCEAAGSVARYAATYLREDLPTGSFTLSRDDPDLA